MLERDLPRPQGHGGGDFGVGFEAHIDQPVDRQHQEQEVKHHPDGTAADPGARERAVDFRRLSRGAACSVQDGAIAHASILLAVGVGHDRVEDPANREDDQVIDDGHGGGFAEVELAERKLDQIDGHEGRRIARALPL